jgi:hypothetical protein
MKGFRNGSFILMITLLFFATGGRLLAHTCIDPFSIGNWCYTTPQTLYGAACGNICFEHVPHTCSSFCNHPETGYYGVADVGCYGDDIEGEEPGTWTCQNFYITCTCEYIGEG